MKQVDMRAKSCSGRYGAEQPDIIDRLEAALHRTGVDATVVKTEAGFIRIGAKDFAEWVIARSIAINDFAFPKENVIWDKPK